MDTRFCNSCRISHPSELGEIISARSSGRTTKVWRCNKCIGLRNNSAIQSQKNNQKPPKAS